MGAEHHTRSLRCFVLSDKMFCSLLTPLLVAVHPSVMMSSISSFFPSSPWYWYISAGDAALPVVLRTDLKQDCFILPWERKWGLLGVQKKETSVCHLRRRCWRAHNLPCGERGALGSLGSTQTLSSVLQEEMWSPKYREVVSEECDDTVVTARMFCSLNE